MVKRYLLIPICFILCFTAAGCSDKEGKISIQKRIGIKSYKFEAYKESVKEEELAPLKEMLVKADWHSYQKEGNIEPAYIFYFNDEREEGKIPVYYVWIDRGSATAELVKNQKQVVGLDEEKTKILLSVIEKKE